MRNFGYHEACLWVYLPNYGVCNWNSNKTLTWLCANLIIYLIDRHIHIKYILYLSDKLSQAFHIQYLTGQLVNYICGHYIIIFKRFVYVTCMYSSLEGWNNYKRFAYNIGCLFLSIFSVVVPVGFLVFLWKCIRALWIWVWWSDLKFLKEKLKFPISFITSHSFSWNQICLKLSTSNKLNWLKLPLLG